MCFLIRSARFMLSGNVIILFPAPPVQEEDGGDVDTGGGGKKRWIRVWPVRSGTTDDTTYAWCLTEHPRLCMFRWEWGNMARTRPASWQDGVRSSAAT